LPRIGDDAAKAIVHVYPNVQSARADRDEGGTGFVMAVPMENVEPLVLDHTYVVTNRHVILGRSEPAVVLQRHDGLRVPIALPASSWLAHPDGEDDIAIAPLPELSLDEYDIAAFPLTYCITKDKVGGLDVGIGVDVYYLGRFKADRDVPSITSIRFGNISSMPVMVRHPRFKKDVESYLVEGRSRGGFSGSPVVAMLKGPIVDTGHSRSVIHLGLDQFLLGIDWSHMTEWQEARVRGTAAELMVDLNAGIMCVAPAWRIADILMRDEFVAQRQSDRDDWIQRNASSQGQIR
jgi:hypothetical protein